MVSRVQRVELLVPTVDKKSYNRIIGMQLVATNDPALIGKNKTEGKRVTFYNLTKKMAHEDQQLWLTQQEINGAMIVPCSVDPDQHLRFAIQQADDVRTGKMRARAWCWKFGNLSSDDAALDAEFCTVRDAIRGGQL